MQYKRITVPKDGSLRVSVNGFVYRWVEHHAGHVVVQHSSDHGSCLIIEPHTTYEPRHIESVVRCALDCSWEPGTDGPNVWYALNVDGEATRIESIESCDGIL